MLLIAEPDSRCGFTGRVRAAAFAGWRGVVERVRELLVALDAGLRGVGLRVAIQ